MAAPLSDNALDQLFRAAHTHNAWQDRPVSTAVLHALYELTKIGPTSANCSAGRFVFITSQEGKARLLKHVSDGNRDKTQAAPLNVIVAHDLEFYEELPKLYPHTDAKSWFTSNDALVQETAFRNGSLQGAYMILAARALGLDVGPMSGFDNAGVDAEFFAGTSVKSNFLMNIGYGDPSGVHDRGPRLGFEDAVTVL